MDGGPRRPVVNAAIVFSINSFVEGSRVLPSEFTVRTFVNDSSADVVLDLDALRDLDCFLASMSKSSFFA